MLGLVMSLTDIGVNFNSKQFHKVGVKKIVRDAQDNGIDIMIGITNCPKDLPFNIRLCKLNSGIFCTGGVHPHDVKSLDDQTLTNIEKQIVANRDVVVAIGECGLDYNRNFSTPESQRHWFLKQIKLAHKLKLPLYLHCRDAFEDFCKIFKECYEDGISFDNGKAVVHCFTDGWKELKAYLDMGFYIGITGWLCDEKRGSRLRQAVKNAVSDPSFRELFLKRVMIETDSPWLAPPDPENPKKRIPYNNPVLVHRVVTKMSQLTGIDEGDFVQMTYDNCVKFFRLDQP
jgi:TatD DNase family protein